MARRQYAAARLRAHLSHPAFARATIPGATATMGFMDLLRELWAFMRERKKLWLLPILVLLLLVGGLLVFAQGSALAPFIYTIF